ncbi:YhfH family protein [Fodinisporobacter ferrooxydans]|uniref:YhfH family protein n=1 Tax=Fodinisporobacter ferrooxydans TaxID=2901836 RepID=A0ABY4CGG2_9BACL|nr:YhfH family protein [Alicyclobacillaceae bacterium MYW30-H2]
MNMTRRPNQELPKKLCVECGKEIEEQVESLHHECERCVSKYEE